MNCCSRRKFSTLFEEIFGNTMYFNDEHEVESDDEYESDDDYASDHTSEGEFEPDEYESDVDPQLELESVLEPRVKAVITPPAPAPEPTPAPAPKPIKMGWQWKLICGI